MKGIYSMKQASHIWNQTFHKTIVSFGFQQLHCKWCVYCCETSSETSIFTIHVDDIIVTFSSPKENDCFKNELQTKWEISDLRFIKFALSIAISCNHPNHTIHLSQTTLIDCIIEQFSQTATYPIETSMVLSLQILCFNTSLYFCQHICLDRSNSISFPHWMPQLPCCYNLA